MLSSPLAGQLAGISTRPAGRAGFGLTLTGLLQQLTWVTNYLWVVGSPVVCTTAEQRQGSVGRSVAAVVFRREQRSLLRSQPVPAALRVD